MGMLCLTRKIGEQVIIPTPLGAIRITLLDVGERVGGGKARIGIDAPDEIPIARDEIFDPTVTPEVWPYTWAPRSA